MSEFEFTPERVDHHVQTIGLEVRPPIEIKDDRVHVQQFYNEVSEQFPHLFESLVQGPAQFRIQKGIPIPGKGRLEITTLTITPKGPTFSFPLTLAGFHDDFTWSRDLGRDVIVALEILKGHLRAINYVRIGKLRELIYTCDKADSNEILKKRFAKNLPEGAGDVTVGWNQCDENYNCRVQLKAVRKQNIVMQQVGEFARQLVAAEEEHGIRVVLDVSNRRVDKPLDSEQLRIILDHADELYAKSLCDELNRGAK